MLFLQTTYNDMKKTSNLEAYVHWFNRLSYFVTTEICSVSFLCYILIHSSKIQRSLEVTLTHNFMDYYKFFCFFVLQHLKKKNRVRIIEYFVDVAKECINMGNFNSLMAIIAGMNMTWVSRLKKTVSNIELIAKTENHLVKCLIDTSGWHLL